MVMQQSLPIGENHPRCGFADQLSLSEPTYIGPRFKVF